jgi:hypothetical protein
MAQSTLTTGVFALDHRDLTKKIPCIRSQDGSCFVLLNCKRGVNTRGLRVVGINHKRSIVPVESLSIIGGHFGSESTIVEKREMFLIAATYNLRRSGGAGICAFRRIKARDRFRKAQIIFTTIRRGK